MSSSSPIIDVNFDRLYQAAKQVRERAHAPYSNYKVGCSLLTTEDDVCIGCNVENAGMYSLSLCTFVCILLAFY